MDSDILDLGMASAEPAPLSDLHKRAILLDIDGTILDIAPSPQQIAVPASLRRTLARLVELTDGALALVSGRAVADIDVIFAPLKLAAIGVHGAEIRRAGDAVPRARAKPLPAALKRRLAAVAELGPDLLVEDKGFSLALHYRRAPDKGEAIRAAVDRICADAADGGIEVLPGRLVVEIKRAGVSKASAVTELMQYPPFAGRSPIFIGDDRTDVPVFDIVPKFGGQAYSVGGIAARVDGHFDTPEEVRAWLARAVAQGEGQ